MTRRSRRVTRCVALIVAVIALPTPRDSGAAGLPDWARHASAQPTPDWARNAPALVLLNEEVIEVPATGRVRYTLRGAIRVLSAAGSRRALYRLEYDRRGDQVRECHAWLVRPDGRIDQWGRGDALDVAAAEAFQLYSDQRALVLGAGDAAPGSVFAWESVREEEPLCAQWAWLFQVDVPTLRSRVSLTLPPNVTAVAQTFGGATPTATQLDRTWSWDMRDVPALPNEPLRTARWSTVASVVLTLPSGSVSSAGMTFADWSAVARWEDAIARPQSAVSAELQARASALTAGVADPVAKLQALAREVQGFNYVSIALDLGHGGGLRPNSATEVLRLRYGDCKDKANLLQAMISATGQHAWLVAVYSLGRDYVEAAWPTPRQFNHCIVAMRVPDTTRLPATIMHPALGRLLLFDPTDPLTAFGDLPADEQGSWGLLIDPAQGGLVQLPVVPFDANRLVRHIDGGLDATGELHARMVERSVGQHAVRERRAWRDADQREYREELEHWLSGGASGVEVQSVRASEDTVTGTFRLEAGFAAPHFGRAIQGRFLSFPPAIISTRRATLTLDSARVLPVALSARSVVESVTVALPEGYEIDEIPSAIHDHRDFATLDADWRVVGSTVEFTRSVTVQPMTLPVARYAEVCEFYAKDQAVSRAQVVLRKP